MAQRRAAKAPPANRSPIRNTGFPKGEDEQRERGTDSGGRGCRRDGAGDGTCGRPPFLCLIGSCVGGFDVLGGLKPAPTGGRQRGAVRLALLWRLLWRLLCSLRPNLRRRR